MHFLPNREISGKVERESEGECRESRLQTSKSALDFCSLSPDSHGDILGTIEASMEW